MNRLKEIRIKSRVAVRKIAAFVGITVTTLYHWESGESRLPAWAVKPLAELYGVTVDDILRAVDETRKAG